MKNSERFGYFGKVLHINLSDKQTWIEEPDEVFWRRYAGGGLLAGYYLYRETPAKIDPLSKENLLIFSSSVMAGHPYPGLARFSVCAKSPLTGGMGEARCEGPFGKALKSSGADVIIFHGQSENPQVVSIEDGNVYFHNAEHLWGCMVGETVDYLKEQFDDSIHTVIIGPAGENQVRYASIVTDRQHQIARMGLGAVMGTKRLKGLVLKGGCLPPVADEDSCKRLAIYYRERMLINPLTRWQHDPPGFSCWVHTHGTDAALCTRNYRDSVFEHAEAYRPEEFMKFYQGEAYCPGCPNNCIKVFSHTKKGDADYDVRAGGIHQEISGTIGPNCGISDLETIFKANILCNQYGLDPTSLGFTLSMAMECAEEGIRVLNTAAGELRFGASDALLEMIHLIAHRNGDGELLAEGSKISSTLIGSKAERYALHVKGLEMVCFEPRTQTNLALGYAVAPIGPRYDICEHDWDFDTQVGWAHTLENSRAVEILERIPMDLLGPEKVMNYKALASLWSGADVLDMCIFAVAPTRVYSLEDMSKLLGAITGWNTSAYEIMRWGERRLHLMRMYNYREGVLADQDILPAQFFEEGLKSEGRFQGVHLNHERFLEVVRTYYLMMGWDEHGVPLPSTLLDHHLEWMLE